MTQIPFENIIQFVLAKRPDLTANGLNSQKILKPRETIQFTEMLLTHEKEFWICVDALQKLCGDKQKYYYSYRLKHVIEKENKTYITNGTLIAAAIYLGLRLRTGNDPSYPNADIRVPARSLMEE